MRVPHPGMYALVLEYASEVDAVQNVNILISGHSDGQILARANIYSCAFSFLCRSVAVNGRNQVAMLQLSHRMEILLQTSTTSFLLYKVYAVPAEEFSLEFVEPKVLCVSTHGRFTENSRYCVPRQPDKPSSAWVLYATRDGQLSSTHAAADQPEEDEDLRQRQQSDLFSVHEPQSDGTLLKYPQTEIRFTPAVPLPGRYVVVVHYHQPEHISFPVEMQVQAGQSWQGVLNASFCPAVSGCKEVLIADGRITLDFEKIPLQPPTISVTVPSGKTLILDYIMLVPDSSYTPELLKENPLDKSADFIKQCTGEGFFIEPRTSSQFCRDSVRSLVAAYNNGALPCDCDKSGSTGTVCDPVGGQCPCRRHVIGRQCTKCATGYYGFPYCKPCQCGRRLCDEVTGRCICPPQTVKPTCEVCQSETFSYHPLLGCENCGCSPNGINPDAGLQCDPSSGQCSCKPLIGGRQCDRCAPGYYRFPDCLPCDCNRGGVTSSVCHPDTGRCLCKRNVAGVRCDTCLDGSFYFDPSNPLGCTSCFCFGATDWCQSSSKRRGKFVEMHGWHLKTPDEEEVPSVLNSVSNTVVADVQELRPAVQTLHWVAPQSYLGNRVSSYGGFLTYQSKSFGIPREGMIPFARGPDVELTGQEMSLIHVASHAPLPDRLYQGRVQLLEENWRHAGTNRPVSREELMVVLAGLVGLKIRALYFTQSQRLSLGEVGLEEATHSGTGGPANTVEVCSCPPSYAGDSCEKCAPGFYRDGNGPYLGRCVPCECNGLADECEDWTGRCLNCQYSTAGDRCERCEEGYYGDAAQRTCSVCPCPLSVSPNSFAVGCREVIGGIQCFCKPGYTGVRCERCAPGYYGNPTRPRGSCRPCNCNGNSNNCDPWTGVCKNALEPGDTNTDEQCQECDNCVLTLLHDLENLDYELARIKAQMGNVSVSDSSKNRLERLEKAVAETKILVDEFRYTIITQKLKVGQLERDMDILTDNVSSLNNKADKRAAEVDTAMDNVEKTHKRAKDLYSEIQHLRNKIKDLQKQLQNQDSRGDSLPNDSVTKMLADAERMVKEMEDRNFTTQETAAEKERDKATKLLDFIKANISKQCDQNEAAAQTIRSLLKDFNAKLKELNDALKDATDLVKKANTQNGVNAKTLETLQKRIKDLEKERKAVEDQMTIANNQLQKTEDFRKMLQDNKNEFEKMIAELDGAKAGLTIKVGNITKAAAKTDIVEAAEKHAKNLTQLAKDLEDAVKNASGRTEVRDAKNAIEAYKNITDAINAAEAAANEAKGAADTALDNVNNQKLTQKSKELKNKGNDLLEIAQDSDKDLQDTVNDLNDLKARLQTAEDKKKALEKQLLNVQSELNATNMDDIKKMIEDAKTKAASANDSATNTADRLNAIKNEISKIKITPVDANLNNVLNDVENSVKNLTNTIPSLMDKISEVENLTSQFSQVNNISESIKMIKELIKQARDAANRVTIPMKFEGGGHVELRPPQSLDDLRAYTALSLSLQRAPGRGDGKRRRRQSDEDVFVLYLGNRDSSKSYIGLVLRSNVLYGLYKLNGVEYEVASSSISTSGSEPFMFDRVDLHRIYQDAELSLTKKITSNLPSDPIQSSKQGEESKDLMDLSPSDVVFYVGGYPSDFTPPASMSYPNYTGCIEFFSFNDQVLSLYNFQKAEGVNLALPCKRYVPTTLSVFFEGTGYGRVPIDPVKISSFRVSLGVRTRSRNGLLFYLRDEDNYLILTMENGAVFLHGNQLEQSPVGLQDPSQNIFPTDSWVEINLLMTTNGLVRLTVGSGTDEIRSNNAQYSITGITEIYIGGTTQELWEKLNITTLPFKGCLRNFKIQREFVELKDSVGISKGCPTDLLALRKAQFSLGSSLSATLTGFSLDKDITVSLGFKSTENQSILFQDKNLANEINLAMENGNVILYLDGKMWRSNKQYHDGLWHYLTVTRRGGSIVLRVDDDDLGQPQTGTTSTPETGGTVILGNGKFKGCISNLYTRRPDNLYRAEDFSMFQDSGEVRLDECSAISPVQLMLGRNSKKNGVMEVINESASSCELPAQVQHAYRLGGAVSSLSYSLPLQVLQPRPHFSLDVRTRSPEGLLFFAPTRGGQCHLALYMSKGRIRLSVAKQKEIFNREKYNDGKWHSVIFSLEKKKFRLVVDGIRAQDGQLTSSELKSMQQFISPVYLGSAPESFHKALRSKDLPKQSVSGCVRNFKMNGAQMSSPTANHGAGPCFEGQTQRGVYFSGNGAHIIFNDSFVVGSTLELLFNIRPRTQSAVLLHVGDSSTNGHFLTVYMLRGEVVVQVSQGGGEFMVSVKPKTSLCDGNFHKISVIKRKNVVQLSVDTMDNYKIGPPSSTSTLTKDPLFVGGIPGTLTHQMFPVKSSFVGCIQDMKINEILVSFDRSSGVFGPVNLKECPG